VESVKIPASKMAAINRVQYHPPPPISFCEGPRIIQKLKDVVVQILELPLYISILFVFHVLLNKAPQVLPPFEFKALFIS
jgi:hypothetical protein